jgi:hypothetical protein
MQAGGKNSRVIQDETIAGTNVPAEITENVILERSFCA